jgi:hypothetical protein
MTAMLGVCTHLVLLLVVSVLQLLDKLNALFKACSSLVLSSFATLLAALNMSDLFALARAVRHNYAVIALIEI